MADLDEKYLPAKMTRTCAENLGALIAAFTMTSILDRTNPSIRRCESRYEWKITRSD